MLSEKDVVRNILPPGTLPEDAVLLVHSAFRNLSRRGLVAEKFIDELLHGLPNGTLLMPAMSWQTVTPQNPVFDEILTKSHTGILGEIFRTKYSTTRSLHPTHSVAGVGPRAGYLLSRHHLGDTPVPAQSPYGLLRDFPAFILMLGVGWEACTAIHHPEEIIAPDIYLETHHENYELRDRSGKKTFYRLRRHRKLPRRFAKFSASFDQAGAKHGQVYEVDWALIEASKVMKIVSQALQTNSRATLD